MDELTEVKKNITLHLEVCNFKDIRQQDLQSKF